MITCSNCGYEDSGHVERNDIKQQGSMKFILFALIVVALVCYLGWQYTSKDDTQSPVIRSSGKLAADETISHGARVVLKDHLAQGKFTVFFFYADW